MTESIRKKKQRAQLIYTLLDTAYSPLPSFLTHRNTFELLIAVILSAQCTDERVNKTTPALFERYPNPSTLATAAVEEVEFYLQSISFFKTKSRHIIATSKALVTHHNRAVPSTMHALIALPGVGRKTANVVLSQAFNIPGISADTHVQRLSRRLGFTTQQGAAKVESALQVIWPQACWGLFSNLLIFHGRQCCTARRPDCTTCLLAPHCPSA